MIQIKKTTTAFIDIDAERRKLREALPEPRQRKLLDTLLGILAFVEKFNVQDAYRLYMGLNETDQHRVNPFIAEMLVDYALKLRLRGTQHSISIAEYDVLPAQRTPYRFN